MRRFALCALGMALAWAVTPSASFAQTIDGPTVEWRHSNWGKRRANTGKFTIKIGYGEMFSKDKENLDSIKLNAIEMADVCNFYHPGKNPAWMVFSLPFLPFGELEQHAAAANAMMKHPALAADMAQWNAVPYFFVVLPPYEFMGKGKPPVDGMGTVLAARNMPAEGSRAAALDRAHHLELGEAHVAAIGLTPSGPVVAEDVRDLQRWPCHECRRLKPAASPAVASAAATDRAGW